MEFVACRMHERIVPKLTCVVLAAGRSTRFGGNKLLYEANGMTLLERALAACGTFPCVAVCSPEVLPQAAARGVRAIRNERPEFGMTHSLQLAHAGIESDHAIAVLPADLALIDAPHVAAIVERSAGFDVTFPARAEGTPGHPVVFSAFARDGIPALPQGDTIRLLRDRADLRRLVVRIDEPWPYEDVDFPA